MKNHKKIKHGLIYPDNNVNNKCASIIFNDKYILTTAFILQTFLLKNNNNDKLTNNLIKCLKSGQAVDVYNDKNFIKLKNQLFYVSYRINNQSNNLYKKKVNILYMFNYKANSDLMDILNKFVTNIYKNNIDKNLSLLLSSFIVLSFEEHTSSYNISNLLNELNVNTIEKSENNKIILKSITNNKLDDVIIKSTPFAHEAFFETVNHGKIVNMYGRNNALMLLSTPLMKGCEGSAVYNNNLELIGIIILTSIISLKDTVIMTIAINYNEILFDFMQQLTKNTTIDIIVKHDSILNRRLQAVPVFRAEKSVVYIKNGLSSASGCLVLINNEKFVITCSHVIYDVNEPIECLLRGESYTTELLFKNPKSEEPYDIALLKTYKNISIKNYVQCAKYIPKIGEQIYSIAYPEFSATVSNIPCIYEGRVTKYEHGILYTDACIQSGQSGGPIFNNLGQLLGVTISNVMSQNKTIYPYNNMAVPICDIYPILEKYTITKNKLTLNELIADENIAKTWRFEIPIISKL